MACLRAVALMGLCTGFMAFVYFYMENNDELQAKMELIIKDINDDTGNLPRLISLSLKVSN